MRKVVTAPNFWGHLKWSRRWFHFKNNLVYNSQIFCPFNFFLLGILFSGLLGFSMPQFRVLGLSLLGYMVTAYFRTERLARGLRIRRSVPRKGRELDQLGVDYEISNETGFALPRLVFEQPFDGTQEGHFAVDLRKSLPPQTRKKFRADVLLSAGMGVKEMGSFEVVVSDDLGLFPFRLEFIGDAEVEVYPRILEVPQLKKVISPDSLSFGNYEIYRRGDSNVFIGTREYRHGDPVRHINWKLSRKTQKLIVNEFDKNTNACATLLLDLELTSQVGFGAFSTWEMGKDLALAIAASETKLMNSVQVIAQGLHVPFGTGEEHLRLLERHFTFHELSSGGETIHLRILEDLPRESQIYFFCPLLFTQGVRETLRILQKLRGQGHFVTVFALDPYREVQRAVSSTASHLVLEFSRSSREEFLRMRPELRKSGLKFIQVIAGERGDLQDVLRKECPELLDGRFL